MVLLTLAVFLLAGCSRSTGAAVGVPVNASFKVAAVVPLTGPGANLGVPFTNGFEMAVDDLNNAGGIRGSPVRLIVEDSKLDPRESVQIVQSRLAIDDPDIFSVMFALPAQAVAPILDQAKKPFLYEAFTRGPLNSSFAFKMNFDALTGCVDLARFAKDHGEYKRLGAIMAQTEYGDLCVQGIRSVEPDVVVYRYPFGDSDFRTLLHKAQNDGVDRLAIVGIDFEFVSLFKQLDELGSPIKILCATASECIFAGVQKVAPPSVLEGTLAIDIVPVNLSETAFGRRYLALYPESSPSALAYGALGFDEGTIIASALRSCSPGDADCVRLSLSRLKGYPSVVGSDGFSDRVLNLETKVYSFDGNRWILRSA